MTPINLGLIGTVAQAAQAGSAPTGVSIASAASGNYDNAVAITEIAVNFADMEIDASSFSSSSASDNVSVGPMVDAFTSISSQATIKVMGYIRATGATSFQWGLSVDSGNTSLTAGTASVSGTASTDQNETADGIGTNGVLTFGGGRGGVAYPSAGDTLAFTVTASATNSFGTTNASSLNFQYNFTS